MSWHAFLEMKRKGNPHPQAEQGPTPAAALSANVPASAAWQSAAWQSAAWQSAAWQSAAWQSAAWQSAAWQSAAASQPKPLVDGVENDHG